ncbi:CHRD domain-containing protein [Aminobacter aminovorans]|uniref:CHRD domain n=1 Tax=Aminobacter aminovorans TaxID=83263 RepID=A0A380WRK1_AMIAI|nr:CHRD domain-containing protein [Aminobacter aminovorans]TCS29915.1 CHRD domain-containing protein [Aminobacter aminovorans]SUU90764.1 CHRD domain [Aminobacter aminovorans]
MSAFKTFALALTLGTLLAVTPSLSETMKFKADLNAASEVPPTDSSGSGTAEVTVDSATRKLSWTVTSTGLSGDATAAHFHGPAAVGENADPVVDISSSVASGSADLTDQQMADLQAGKWYLNLHTQKFPDGEIRGQVEKAE